MGERISVLKIYCPVGSAGIPQETQGSQEEAEELKEELMVELRVPPYEPSEVLESGTELLSGMSEIPRLQFHCKTTDLHVNKLISSWFVVFPV